MTNLEKMNELVNEPGDYDDKKDIKDWAYVNRVWLDYLPKHDEFRSMENSVKAFKETDFFKKNKMMDEFEVWDKFLDAEYVE